MLINNAGVVSGRALLDTPDELIERSFNVNVLAHFWVKKFNVKCLTAFLVPQISKFIPIFTSFLSRSWFRQQKPFYRRCLRKTMAISWQLLRWLATLALQNWLTTVPVNLPRLVSMRHCVWSSSYSVVTCKPHAFAHISSNRPACLKMSTQGKYTHFNANWRECNSHNHKIPLIFYWILFASIDGYPHWHPKMLQIVSSMPFNIKKNLRSFHATCNWCFVLNGEHIFGRKVAHLASFWPHI